VAAYWLLGREDSDAAAHTELFASAVGQRRRLVLPDGSGLLLDASSRVAVDFAQGSRAIVLEQGAARFDVRHDPARPFEVHTPQARMTALGTSFSVDHGRDGSELRVFSGKVGLDAASGERLMVPARQWAMVGASAITGHGTFDPAAGDWQSDWLDAQAMPLGRAVERLGRYSATPLRLGQAQFASLTFSGRFRLDTPEQSLVLIGALFGLTLQRHGNAIYLDEAVPA
jgi:transmembrane sensor